MQGFKLNLAVFDEQPPDDFFSEIVTRTATTQGKILCSFTPLKGLNGLVSKLWNREAGYDFIRVAWDDVPEYDPSDSYEIESLGTMFQNTTHGAKLSCSKALANN